MIGSSTVFYGLFLPAAGMLLISFLILPAMLRSGGKAEDIGKAAYCYLAQSVGILLMALGGMPALYAVLASQPLAGMMYTGLLLLFALGGIVYLSHDTAVRSIDPAARAVSGTVFFYTWKLMGLAAVLFAVSGLLLRLAAGGATDARWWVFYAVLLVFGGVITWFTQMPRAVGPVFRSAPIAPVPAAKAAQPAAKRKTSKKK